MAEERHFGRAARRLRIAAPSLSQQIRALERDLNATLFERSPRSVVLSPAGEVLLEHAHVLLAPLELIWREPAHPALRDVVARLAGTEV